MDIHKTQDMWNFINSSYAQLEFINGLRYSSYLKLTSIRLTCLKEANFFMSFDSFNFDLPGMGSGDKMDRKG